MVMEIHGTLSSDYRLHSEHLAVTLRSRPFRTRTCHN
jgi:hypothetical protein